MGEQELEDCRNCGPSDFEELGFIPSSLVDEVSSKHWIEAYLCTSCGDIRVVSIDEEKLQEAIDNIVELYEEYDLSDEEELEHLRR